MDHSDSQLIANYNKGDDASFNLLVERYLKPVYSFVYRYVNDTHNAEDITQEVFLKVWRNLGKFDQKKNFKTWIFTIAKNTAIDLLKKKKEVPFSAFSTRVGSAFRGENDEGENTFVETLADSAPLPDIIFERAAMARMLSKAIQKLAVPYQVVLSLRYNNDLSFREVATVLNEPLHTVKSRHRRALSMLKHFFLNK